MAKAPKSRKLTARTAGGGAPPAPIALAGADLADFPDALALINSLSGERDGIEWDIKVYLATGTGGRGNTAKPQFLFSVELEDLPQLEQRLAEIYADQGGGDFRVMVRADNELVKNIPISIAPRPGWKPPPPSYMLAATAPAAAAPAGNAAEQVFLRLAELQAASEKRITDLIAAIAAKPEARQPTLLEQIQLMTEIQKLAPKGAQENGMEMFNKAFDLARTMYEGRDSGGGGKTWIDVVESALNSPIIKDMLAGAVASAANAQPAQLGPPRLVSPQNPGAVQMMDTLLRQATLNLDPKAMADQILENAPPALLTELEQVEEQGGDIASYIIQQFPQAAPHRSWLEQVIANIWVEGDARVSPTLAPQPPHAAQEAAARPQT